MNHDHLKIEAFINVDWSRSPDDGRLTSAFYTLGGNLVTCRSKKELVVVSLVLKQSIEQWHLEFVNFCGLKH